MIINSSGQIITMWMILIMILIRPTFVDSSLFLLLIMIIIWYYFSFHYFCYKSSWFYSVYRITRFVLMLLLLWLVRRRVLTLLFLFLTIPLNSSFTFLLLLRLGRAHFHWSIQFKSIDVSVTTTFQVNYCCVHLLLTSSNGESIHRCRLRTGSALLLCLLLLFDSSSIY